LRRKGHFVWVDEAEIRAGESLIEKISQGLENVEFVVAFLSKTSIKSEWVKRELNIAITLEINAKKYQVTPILVHTVKLPAFLSDRKYLDFRSPKLIRKNIRELLKRFGPAKSLIRIEPKRLRLIKQKLASLSKELREHSDETNDRLRYLVKTRSPSLKAQIKKENRQFPQYARINNAYAFEIDDVPVTLDGVLWAIEKSKRTGGHPLELLLTINGTWPIVKRMIKAYAESAQ
jgi:hypothetical protein